MLHIPITIVIVISFTKLAGKKNLNKSFWGIIGAASYLVPILIMSLVVLPDLFTGSRFKTMDQMSLTLFTFGINLLTGLLWCYLTYKVLKAQKEIIDEPKANPHAKELD